MSDEQAIDLGTVYLCISARTRRPINGFQLYYRKSAGELRNTAAESQAEVPTVSEMSKIASEGWKSLSEDKRAEWHAVARKQTDMDDILERTCKKCGRSFSRMNLLTHHQRECGECFCPVCDKRFADGISLKRHVKIHSGTLIACSLCEKLFYTTQSLKRHIEAIHMRISYACPASECTKRFTMKSAVNKHYAKTHPNAPTSTATATAGLDNNVEHGDIDDNVLHGDTRGDVETGYAPLISQLQTVECSEYVGQALTDTSMHVGLHACTEYALDEIRGGHSASQADECSRYTGTTVASNNMAVQSREVYVRQAGTGANVAVQYGGCSGGMQVQYSESSRYLGHAVVSSESDGYLGQAVVSSNAQRNMRVEFDECAEFLDDVELEFSDPHGELAIVADNDLVIVADNE